MYPVVATVFEKLDILMFSPFFLYERYTGLNSRQFITHLKNRTAVVSAREYDWMIKDTLVPKLYAPYALHKY